MSNMKHIVKYEIWQMRPDMPGKFMPLSVNSGLKLSWYDKKHEGEYENSVPAKPSPLQVLEDLFREHNMDSRPNPMGMHSMSVSDIVTLEPGTPDESGWYCDSIGFTKIDLAAARA